MILRKKGFSLIELMVVMSIFLILAVITIPLYRTYRYKQTSINSALILAEDLRAQMQRAKTMDANLAEGTSAGIWINPDRSYTLYEYRTGGSLITTKNVNMGAQFQNSVVIMLLPNSGQSYTRMNFYYKASDGWKGQIVIDCMGYRSTITVNPTVGGVLQEGVVTVVKNY